MTNGAILAHRKAWWYTDVFSKAEVAVEEVKESKNFILM